MDNTGGFGEASCSVCTLLGLRSMHSSFRPTSTIPVIKIMERFAGLAIVIVALSELGSLRQWNEWLKLAVGAWQVVASWMIGFSHNVSLAYNDVMIGVLLVAIGGTTLAATRHYIGSDL